MEEHPLPEQEHLKLLQWLHLDAANTVAALMEQQIALREAHAANMLSKMRDYPRFQDSVLSELAEANRLKTFLDVLRELQGRADPFKNVTLKPDKYAHTS